MLISSTTQVLTPPVVGLVSLFRGDMVGQAKGMGGRVAFQILTIGMLVGAVSFRQNEKLAEKEAKEKRRAERKRQAEELKAAQENSKAHE